MIVRYSLSLVILSAHLVLGPLLIVLLLAPLWYGLKAECLLKLVFQDFLSYPYLMLENWLVFLGVHVNMFMPFLPQCCEVKKAKCFSNSFARATHYLRNMVHNRLAVCASIQILSVGEALAGTWWKRLRACPFLIVHMRIRVPNILAIDSGSSLTAGLAIRALAGANGSALITLVFRYLQ